jgi:succinyl-CoA synthetase beta subunit
VGYGRHFARRGTPAAPLALAGPPPEIPRHPVGEFEAKRILAAAGIPVVEERLAKSAAEAVRCASALGYPIVLKIASPAIAHKSEIGGVLLNLTTAAEVRKGFATLMERARTKAPAARLDGVLVATQVQGGVEVILGVNRDPVFGPVVMFGLGGIFVEILKDITLRIAPFGIEEARRMIREVQGFPLLDGARGRPKADVEALAQALARLSTFAAARADALETLDINPFIVLPEGKGGFAVDALIVPRES